MRRLATLIWLLLLAAPPDVAAQVPVTGTARPTPAPELPAPTTGIIRGRARMAVDGAPVRGAQLQLATENGGYRQAVTDDQGQYEFRDVPAGPMQISASKPGFVVVRDVARSRVEQERRITIAAGDTLEQVDFTFVVGGVITGQVLDETGETVIGARVQLARPRYVDGRRTMQVTNSAQTDDRGEYRIFGVAPGDYYLSASHPVPRGTSPAGEIEYATTYFPNTADRGQAERVSIGAGDEMMGFSIALQRTRSARITGVVQGSAVATATVVRASAATGSDVDDIAGGRVQPDGSFVIAGVTPGRYTLTAISLLDRELTARADVDVDGADVAGVVLAMTPGVKARGRIVFDEPRPAGLRPEDVRVIAVEEQGGFSRNDLPPTAREDWTFELSGLSGPHRLLAGVLTAGAPQWSTAGVRLNGDDVTDSGIEFGSEDVDGIEIVLTRQQTVLSGVVTGPDGRPAPSATVLLFADDSSRWGPRSRYVGAAHPDQAGRYIMSGYPPARYRAIALDEVENGEERDPDLLETWRERATMVELHEGETRSLELQMIPR